MESSHQTADKPTAWQNFKSLLLAVRRALRPPEPLRLSEWANKYAMLSKETSSQTGRFRSFRYQDGIMDAFTDPTVETISVMKSARVGYTKILDHVIGYYIAHDPSPILAIQPRETDAEDYSKTEIAPMLRDTPVLAEVTGGAKAKDSNQTILKRTFSNGANLTLVGANSPGGFRRITCRIILFDEVDGYPASGAGNEGDQIALGKSVLNRSGTARLASVQRRPLRASAVSKSRSTTATSVTSLCLARIAAKCRCWNGATARRPTASSGTATRKATASRNGLLRLQA